MAESDAARAATWRTKLAGTGRKQIRITAPADLEPLLRALVDRIGLERVPARRAALMAALQAAIPTFEPAPAAAARPPDEAAAEAAALRPLATAPSGAGRADRADPGAPSGGSGHGRSGASAGGPPGGRDAPGAAATEAARPPTPAQLQQAVALAARRRIALPDAVQRDRRACEAFLRGRG